MAQHDHKCVRTVNIETNIVFVLEAVTANSERLPKEHLPSLPGPGALDRNFTLLIPNRMPPRNLISGCALESRSAAQIRGWPAEHTCPALRPQRDSARRTTSS